MTATIDSLALRTVRVSVHPAAGGWEMACDLPVEPVYFRSGASAEAAARSLAVRLSGEGNDVKLTVHDRAARPIATQRYFAY